LEAVRDPGLADPGLRGAGRTRARTELRRARRRQAAGGRGHIGARLTGSGLAPAVGAGTEAGTSTSGPVQLSRQVEAVAARGRCPALGARRRRAPPDRGLGWRRQRAVASWIGRGGQPRRPAGGCALSGSTGADLHQGLYLRRGHGQPRRAQRGLEDWPGLDALRYRRAGHGAGRFRARVRPRWPPPGIWSWTGTGSTSPMPARTSWGCSTWNG
jgi:hypothetical protein